jgi:myo-inositol-1(or 4)-monophosphatase
MADDLELALEVAREAGRILMEGYGRRQRVDRKGWRDLVSETDLAAQRAIAAILERERPGDGLLAEEALQRPGRSGRRWIVDPLDGTTNFVHGHPMFCVSLALEEEGEVTLGVIWAPYLGELFWAVRGRGGRFRAESLGWEAPLRVSATAELAEALLSTGFPYLQAERRNTNLGNFQRVTLRARGVRRGGSAALDLAYVACGRFDGFWELYLNPWDVAAGALMVQEAGGRVGDLSGGALWRTGWEIVATNGRIHEALAACLEPADPADLTAPGAGS